MCRDMSNIKESWIFKLPIYKVELEHGDADKHMNWTILVLRCKTKMGSVQIRRNWQKLYSHDKNLHETDSCIASFYSCDWHMTRENGNYMNPWQNSFSPLNYRKS